MKFLFETQDPIPRFWARVQKSDGCWLWTGCVTAQGYGEMSVNGHPTTMHRYSYELHHGPIPKGLFVCHTCDVKRCVRPDHLYAGTVADNARDAVQRGRTNKGKRWQRPLRETCRRGHEYAKHGRFRVRKNGWREQICVICDRVRQQRYRDAAA